jgi:1,2-diacylglycerol 3-beta-galactosyltransferase
MASPEQPPLPLLFLIGDTGGGHRSAAAAVQQALDGTAPGRFETVICDALRGPDVPWLQRWWAGLYGPCIRLTPWLWWLFWRSCQSPRVLRVARHTAMGAVYGSVARAIQACQPALIVVFHPMTTDPAVRARNRGGAQAPVVTVITDLVTAHLAWRDAPVDRVVVPSAAVADSFARDGVPPERYVPLGLPVAAEFCRPPLNEAEREALKRELGVRGKFLVVLTGGAEGSGGLRRRATAILRQVEDVDVAVICGRNRSLRRRVSKLAAHRGDGRLTAHGFVDNMADWLRCADIVVGKAGPGTIAEASCCGAPLVLTSYVRGQEKGNIEYVTDGGGGIYAPRPRQLVEEIGRLRRDPAALAVMRAASARAGRPAAAVDIARFITDLIDPASINPIAAEETGGWPAENALLPTLIADTPPRRELLTFFLTDAADS